MTYAYNCQGQYVISCMTYNMLRCESNALFDFIRSCLTVYFPHDSPFSIGSFSLVHVNFDDIVSQVNKPYLPLASGEYSVKTGVMIVSSFAIIVSSMLFHGV